MANEMMVIQHNCEGLLRFILPDDTVTIDMEVMTLKGIHIFRQDKHSNEKTFIPWSEDNTAPSSFLKRVRETQTKPSKEFMESVLDQNLIPNSSPKHPCACPKIAKLSDNDFIQDTKLRMAREVEKDNIPVRNMEMRDLDHYGLPKPDRKIPSDWSDSEDGKDDQARAKPLDAQDPRPSTSFPSDVTPLR